MRKLTQSTLLRLSMGIFILWTNVLSLAAQNITSPYSILGIGDIDTKDFGRYFGSGNAALARRDMHSYNFSNPASLSALPFKTVHFDIATRGRNARFTLPEGEEGLGIPSNDFIVKRVSMAAKITNKSAIAFGLRPYSSVNYFYIQDKAVLDGNTSYFKLVEGDGGINQVYFSYGKEVNKHLSVGATASWLFGSLQRVTQYQSPAIALDIVRDEKDFYNGSTLHLGLQYYSLPGKKWRHQVGMAASAGTPLRGEKTTLYNDPTGLISKEVENNRTFKLPVSVGVAYSAVKSDKITFSLEGNYYHWDYQKVNYANSYTYPSVRLSTGIEYAFIKKQGGASYEKGYISIGANIENAYLHIEKNKLWDYSLSLGLGRNITRNMSFYTGIEFGNKGQLNLNQVRENYTQYVIGVTVKDLWIGPRYSRRYD
jgi:hypothetical protein